MRPYPHFLCWQLRSTAYTQAELTVRSAVASSFVGRGLSTLTMLVLYAFTACNTRDHCVASLTKVARPWCLLALRAASPKPGRLSDVFQCVSRRRNAIVLLVFCVFNHT